MSNFTRIVGIVVAFGGFSKHTFAQELFGDENVITARTAGHSPSLPPISTATAIPMSSPLHFLTTRLPGLRTPIS